MSQKRKTKKELIGRTVRTILLFVIIAELILLGIQWKKSQPKELMQTAKQKVQQELDERAQKKADEIEDDINAEIKAGEEADAKKKSAESKKAALTKFDEKVMSDLSDSEIAELKQECKDRFDSNYIIGDSLTEGLTVYGWLSEEQVGSKVGASVKAGEDLFRQAASKKPEHAFFAFGMNDMGNYSNDEDAFIEAYKGRLETFASGAPDAKIYVCSISIPTESARSKNQYIREYDEFNKAMKAMCKEEGYTFIDSTEILENYPELYAGDGIHVSSKYYPMWLERLFQAADID